MLWPQRMVPIDKIFQQFRIRLLARGTSLLAVCLRVAIVSWGLADGIIHAAELEEEIVAVWTARERAIRSIHLEWHSEVNYLWIPDHTYQSPGELALDASGRIRCLGDSFTVERDKRPLGQRSRRAIVEHSLRAKVQRSLYVFDGHRSVLLFPKLDEHYDVDYPVAFIGDRGKGVGPETRLLPLRLLYRPFDQDLGVCSPEAIRVQGTGVSAGEQMCHVVIANNLEIWVTADADFLPVRAFIRHNVGDVVRSEHLVTYAQDAGEQFRPVAWTWIQFGSDGETIVESRETTIDRISINQPLPDDLFQINEFENGTWVKDYAGGGQRYIVRDGRPNRRVYAGEYTGDNYEYLYNSEPPEHLVRHAEAAAPPSSSRSWLMIGVNVLLVLGIVAFFLRRRHRPSGIGNE